MKTVKEVSRLTGVSIRTLHHYDQIGLLPPAAVTKAGYRLYDDASLERLQQILLFRELEFPLSDIRAMLDSPSFDREAALTRQIEWLTLKKERLERLIVHAREIQQKGESNLDFEAFDKSKMNEYAKQAKEQWGDTAAYAEYERRAKTQSADEQVRAGEGLMRLFEAFGAMRAQSPDAPEVQAQVERLQAYITEHFYTCTKPILAGLGQLYAAGGEMTDNIDRAGGEGTAAFVAAAIAAHCGD